MALKTFVLADQQKSDKPVQFKVGSHTFTGLPPKEVPRGAVLPLLRSAKEQDGAGSVVAVYDFLEMVLEPESSIRFINLSTKPSKEPIEDDDVVGVFNYLLEVYSARPTK
jgi:hypothetical protein